MCFHLFSARRHESLRDHQESELLRTPLEVFIVAESIMNLGVLHTVAAAVVATIYAGFPVIFPSLFFAPKNGVTVRESIHLFCTSIRHPINPREKPGSHQSSTLVLARRTVELLKIQN